MAAVRYFKKQKPEVAGAKEILTALTPDGIRVAAQNCLLDDRYVKVVLYLDAGE